MRTVTLRTGEKIPQLGAGTWHMGERGANRPAQAKALRAAIDLGITLIDTAEMYGEGAPRRSSPTQRPVCATSCSSSPRSIRTMPRARASLPPASAA